MKILIRERLKPFSHTPGSSCLLPGTLLKIEAFPTLIRIGKKIALSLGLSGPVRGFTLEQDLEKNRVIIFGHAKEGFYRLEIKANSSGIEVIVLNTPPGALTINDKLLKRREKLVFSETTDFFLPPVWERLSLGMHRKQDWDLVLRRFDLKEILPVLFGLGQKVPSQTRGELGVVAPELSDLEAFCRTAFSNILVPRAFDDQHQGVVSKLETISQAAIALRSLFFAQEGTKLRLLPAPLFHSGRLVHLQAVGIGEIDLEWASKKLKRAILRSSSTQEISLRLQAELHSFRIRSSLSQKGVRHSVETPLAIEKGKTYFLDRFQKS